MTLVFPVDNIDNIDIDNNIDNIDEGTCSWKSKRMVDGGGGGGGNGGVYLESYMREARGGE